MRTAHPLLTLFTWVFSFATLAQNAPVLTTAGMTSYGPTANVLVTVGGFTDIGSFSLKVTYDPAVLLATSVTKNPALPGNLLANMSVPGTITLGWFNYPGATLADNSILFTMAFQQLEPGYSAITWLDNGSSCYWTDGSNNYLNDVPYDDFYNNGYVDGSLYLDLKVFPEGPFSSGFLGTALNSGLLPLSQPFGIAPWNYTGTESVTSIPNADVVDWLLLELRDTPGDAATATSSTLVARQAAFLMKDGKVRALDGTSAPLLASFIADNFYLVVRHRNHLGIMSSVPLEQSGGQYSYDFTSSAAKAYLAGQKLIAPGVYGMVAGDADADGTVDAADMEMIWQADAGMHGYFGSDINLDGQVNNPDKNEKWLKNLDLTTKIPE